MQIIAEQEPSRRGIYAGAVGYLDFAGNLDFCIAIRTIVMLGRRALVQAGAGIVADSNPTAEYEETRDKAKALVRALELAAARLVGTEKHVVLVIDNFDSFTYNLVQYLGELGARPLVYRNDAITLGEIEALSPAHIVISPGPGRPEDAGISARVIEAFGAAHSRARRVPRPPGDRPGVRRTGRARAASRPREDVDGRARRQGAVRRPARGVRRPRATTRCACPTRAGPPTLEVAARSADDRVVMALRHRSMPIHGVQFHPESVLTADGRHLLRNFLALSRAEVRDVR